MEQWIMSRSSALPHQHKKPQVAMTPPPPPSFSVDVERGYGHSIPGYRHTYATSALLRPYRSRDPPPLFDNHSISPSASASASASAYPLPRRSMSLPQPSHAAPPPYPPPDYGFCEPRCPTSAPENRLSPPPHQYQRRFPHLPHEDPRILIAAHAPRIPDSGLPPRNSRRRQPVERFVVFSRRGGDGFAPVTTKNWKKKAQAQIWRPLNKLPPPAVSGLSGGGAPGEKSDGVGVEAHLFVAPSHEHQRKPIVAARFSKARRGCCRVNPHQDEKGLQMDVATSTSEGAKKSRNPVAEAIPISGVSLPAAIISISTPTPNDQAEMPTTAEGRAEFVESAKTSTTAVERGFYMIDDDPPINAADGHVAALALQGPELDVFKELESEESVVPVEEKRPFLQRFPIGCFGICLGLASQSILWKALAATTAAQPWMRGAAAAAAAPLLNLGLWYMAVATLVCVSVTYGMKCIYYPEAVRREFYDPMRSNFFFAPWIGGMLVSLGVPAGVGQGRVHPVVWLLFMAPILALELKMYGHWMVAGGRRLSEVANPTAHLSLMANFVGALLAATVEWREPAIFAWAVGLAHYVVLFVTLYQRLPSAAPIPKHLHPIFFLFVAAPAHASVAWAKIVGDFDLVSRITYFLGLFLYSCLVVRINFFRGFRFSVAWWAYTTPMTSSAIATIQYSMKVRNRLTEAMALLLSSVSSVTVLTMCLLTFLHIFYWRNMFPNDAAVVVLKERNQEQQQKENHAAI